MIEFNNYEKAVLVSGDGDFYCLADHLKKQEKLESILVPNEQKYSALLKKINEETNKYLVFISQMKNKLEYK